MEVLGGLALLLFISGCTVGATSPVISPLVLVIVLISTTGRAKIWPFVKVAIITGTMLLVSHEVTKYLVSVLLIAELVFVIKSVFIPATSTGIMSMPLEEFGNVAPVSKLLFTRYLYPFDLTGILLLVAIVVP